MQILFLNQQNYSYNKIKPVNLNQKIRIFFFVFFKQQLKNLLSSGVRVCFTETKTTVSSHDKAKTIDNRQKWLLDINEKKNTIFFKKKLIDSFLQPNIS